MHVAEVLSEFLPIPNPVSMYVVTQDFTAKTTL